MALVAYLVSGVANGVIDVAGFTLVQRSSPTAARLSVFGILEASVGATAAIGGSSRAADRGVRDARGTRHHRSDPANPRRRDVAADQARRRRGPHPDHEVRLLRGIPLFAPLPMTALERIAGSRTPMSHAAGQTIFREGDPGDSYLIIAEGEVEVSQAGRPVNRLGAGEGFGEIALLNAVPRTATVTALTATSGYALSGTEFLGAIAGPTSMAAATLIARERRDRPEAARPKPSRPGDSVRETSRSWVLTRSMRQRSTAASMERVAVHERPELAPAESEELGRRLGGGRRSPRAVVDECDLAEEVAGAHRPDGLAAVVDANRALDDHEELRAGRAFPRQHLARGHVDFLAVQLDLLEVLA